MKKPSPKIYLYGAAACVVAAMALGYYYLFSSFTHHDSTEYVYIDRDDNIDSVFAKLRPIGSHHGMSGFITLARHNDFGSKIKTGRYAVNPDEGAFTLYRRIKNGQQSALQLTIPEARTMQRLSALLARKLMVDSAEIAKALTDNIYLNKYGYDTATVSALFIPNTYEVYWNMSIDNLMERMVKEHNAFWTAERKQKADAMGMSLVEVATLASIIDEETANNGEKPMIAGMYLNRLKTNMPLQADPTIKFALKDFALRRIYHKQLKVESPYNTYVNTGLPPGPIKVASVAGIDAVLNHVEHNYLYMCAKEDFSGTHNFARTYTEHLANAARYTKAFGLKKTSRIKAFVFRFISVPAKWIMTARQYVLNIYTENRAYAKPFKTGFG